MYFDILDAVHCRKHYFLPDNLTGKLTLFCLYFIKTLHYYSAYIIAQPLFYIDFDDKTEIILTNKKLVLSVLEQGFV